MLGPPWKRWTRGGDRSDGRIPPTLWESAPLDARKRSFGINLGSSRDPAVPEAGEPRGTRGRSRYRLYVECAASVSDPAPSRRS